MECRLKKNLFNAYGWRQMTTPRKKTIEKQSRIYSTPKFEPEEECESMFLLVHQQTVEKEDNREIHHKCSVLLPIWEGNEIIEQKKTIEKGFIGYLVVGWGGVVGAQANYGW
ncbi:unnamed protein product [Lactuca virosa]|uniref:Uncharacterized protein n=1 Tax=Lactuca virosa TaxID=75947 RepID=A0AAU9P6A2_9ASTR|nr:unnamed protein product [Lactuca virosa]